MRRTVLLCTVSFIALAFAGCEDDPELLVVDESTLTVNLQKHLETHIVGVSRSAGFVETSNMMTQVTEEEAPSPTPTPEPDGGGGGEMEDGAREMVDFLKQHVFVTANVEAKSSTAVTYRLMPEVMCPKPDPEFPEDAAECIDWLTQIPVRFVVSSPATDVYKVKVQIGTQKLSPGDFEISAQKLAVEVDLAAAKAVVELVQNTFAEGEQVELPEVMQGRVLLQLVRNGEDDFTATYGVLQPVKVKFEGLDIALAAAPQAIVAHVVAATKLVEITAAMGAVDISVPGEMLQGSSEICETDTQGNFNCWQENTGPTGGVFAIHSAGPSGKITFDASGTEKLVFENVSLGAGATTLKVDGKSLLELELSQAFSGQLEDLGENFRLTVEPGINLLVKLGMQNMLAYLDDQTEVEAWTLDEQLEITIAGVFESLSNDNGSWLKVISGSFRLWAASGIEVNAEAGLCLSTPAIDETPGEHPFNDWSAVACP